jgi:hypothetical protein
MTPDEEAALRKCILDAQFRAARSERKGSNTSRPDDPSWHFERAREYAAEAEMLQRKLEAAGLRREPDRTWWDFTWP